MKRLFLFPFLFALLWGSACNDASNPAPSPAPPQPVVGSAKLQVIKDTFEGKPIVVLGSGQQNLAVSFFEENEDGEALELSLSQSIGADLLQDQDGNKYNLFGIAIDGPDRGSRLRPTYGFMSYWFALPLFYEQVSIYEGTPGPVYPVPEVQDNGWLVPSNQVLASTAQDGIPSIDDPKFISLAPTPDNSTNPDLVQDNELLIGVFIDAELRLYPHKILDWHEIVNDQAGEVPFSLIYCPLTGTASAWVRKVDGESTTFGVSGLLYNSNVVPYDRKTGSRWSQLKEQCINGEQIGNTPQMLPTIETTWANWKRLFDDPPVLSFDTGFGRSYGIYPYGDYRENHDNFLFPLLREDDRVPAKERVHVVVINNKARVYRFSSL